MKSRAEMISWLEDAVAKIDAEINTTCSKLRPEGTVERNTDLHLLVELIGTRDRLIQDLGDLKFGLKNPEDLPLYELLS